MYFEDPLLKQDGTFLTRVDVAILKVASVIATLFREESEVSYTEALKRMLIFGCVYFGCLGLTLALTGYYMHAVTTWVLGAIPFVTAIWSEVTCSASGTVLETQSNKLAFLFLLFAGPIFLFPFAALYYQPGPGLNPEVVFWIGWGIGATYVAFLIGYVRRLGEPPKKKEKAKASQHTLVPH